MLATTRLEVLGLTLADPNVKELDVDAAMDALYVVPTGEATCRHHIDGISAPGGDWCWGEDEDVLPPWIDSEGLCPAWYGWGGAIAPREVRNPTMINERLHTCA